LKGERERKGSSAKRTLWNAQPSEKWLGEKRKKEKVGRGGPVNELFFLPSLWEKKKKGEKKGVGAFNLRYFKISIFCMVKR